MRLVIAHTFSVASAASSCLFFVDCFYSNTYIGACDFETCMNFYALGFVIIVFATVALVGYYLFRRYCA
jgi:hypothetical protein